MFKPDQCSSVVSSMKPTNVYLSTQVLTQPIFTYKLKYKPDQCLPIDSSINSTNFNP